MVSDEPSASARFVEDAIDVELDGPCADAERLGDELVGEAAGDERQDLGLAGGQLPAPARGGEHLGDRSIRERRSQNGQKAGGLTSITEGVRSQTAVGRSTPARRLGPPPRARSSAR